MSCINAWSLSCSSNSTFDWIGDSLNVGTSTKYKNKKLRKASKSQPFNSKAKLCRENVVIQKMILKAQSTNKDNFDNAIIGMVGQWNAAHPKGPHYYDFHGLTVKMAGVYIKEIIDAIADCPQNWSRKSLNGRI